MDQTPLTGMFSNAQLEAHPVSPMKAQMLSIRVNSYWIWLFKSLKTPIRTDPSACSKYTLSRDILGVI